MQILGRIPMMLAIVQPITLLNLCKTDIRAITRDSDKFATIKTSEICSTPRMHNTNECRGPLIPRVVDPQ